MPVPLAGVWFGRRPYPAALDLQMAWLDARIADRVGDTILFGEHPPVITSGRGSHDENILAPGNIPVVPVNRGGDVTYHGPGQLMAYPILKLAPGERDLHQVLRRAEDAIILLLADYGLIAERKPDWTGVWLADPQGNARKVASIGFAVRQWVTYHGVALNVTTPAEDFAAIRPCGLPDQVMAPISAWVPDPLGLEAVARQALSAFAKAFGRSLRSPAWLAADATAAV